MFQLSRAGDYAVRAAVFLATDPHRPTRSITDIAHAENVPENFLRKIIQSLIRAKLVRSVRGIHGGVVLAKKPEQTSLLEVVEAIEGPLALNKCVLGPGECDRQSWCPVHTVWCEAQEKLLTILRSKTLADLAKDY